MRLNPHLHPLYVCIAALMLTACGVPPAPTQVAAPTQPQTSSPDDGNITNSDTLRIQADVWADNWFAFYLGATLVKEDSVSITTERSFNKETFQFEGTYPLQLNFIVKDFKENDTGLEYIGTERQQMGDGGFIAQFVNTETGALIAVTNTDWSCLVIHEAPLDTACEKAANPVAGQAACQFNALPEPTGWQNLAFDDAAWAKATHYTAEQVGAKEGYSEVTWNAKAQLIWGPNLKTNNTLLCRLTVSAP